MSVRVSHFQPLLRARQRREVRALSLQRTTTGWTLLDGRDRVVLAADGANARRQCLAHAGALGVLRLTFDEQLRAASRGPQGPA